MSRMIGIRCLSGNMMVFSKRSSSTYVVQLIKQDFNSKVVRDVCPFCVKDFCSGKNVPSSSKDEFILSDDLDSFSLCEWLSFNNCEIMSTYLDKQCSRFARIDIFCGLPQAIPLEPKELSSDEIEGFSDFYRLFKLENRFSVLEDDVSTDTTDDDFDYTPFFKCLKKKKKLVIKRKKKSPNSFEYKRLKEKLRIYRIKNPIILKDDVIGQMDSEQSAHGVIKSQLDQHSNVILSDNRQISSAVASNVSNDTYADLAATNVPFDITSFSDRWLTFDTFEWDSSDSSATKSYSLPNHVLKEHQDSPNVMPFLQNTYWRGDMIVRVLVNSNVRQFGQLQIRFYYGANYDDKMKIRNNIYVGSQMPHCLISASSSNVGELSIPFEYVNPYLKLKTTTSDIPTAYASLGFLYINPVVSLTAASTTAKTCSVSVLIRFENSKFVGMIDRGLMTAQMFSPSKIVKGVAMNLLSNLDKPTDVQVGSLVIPQNTASWASGTNVAEFNNVLRLNPMSILTYLPGRKPPIDEMKIDYIKRIFGMFNIYSWSASDSVGSILASFPADPLLNRKTIHEEIIDLQPCWCLPPVSVLSSIFGFWRGSLEFRFDIVGSTELTGRLLIAYVPLQYKTITMKQAMNCMHTIYDLQDNRQFINIVPFISDLLMRRRKYDFSIPTATHKYQSNTVKSPGTIFIFVYNKLIANSTIPDNCKIVSYLRGGEDFEVAVPSQPLVGLGFDTQVYYNKDFIDSVIPRDGYFPVYCGTWHTFSNGRKYYNILRFSAISDQVALFTIQGKQVPLETYWGKVLKTADSSFAMYMYVKGVSAGYRVVYYVLTGIPPTYDYKNDYAPYWYAVPFYDLSKARSFASLVTLYEIATPRQDFDANAYYGILPVADGKSGEFGTPNFFRLIVVPDKELVGQMDDERSNIESSPALPVQSVSGVLSQHLGESFTDLKDYCRRFQLYKEGKVYVSVDGFSNNSVDLIIPLLPQGLDLDKGNSTNINEFWNRLRDGPIPIICSGFRFFTGGLRIRVVIDSVKTHKIYLSHCPTVLSKSVSINNPADIFAVDYQPMGVAYHVQQSLTNSIVSIEVPYYMPSLRVFLQRPSDSAFAEVLSTLGTLNLACTFQNTFRKDYTYKIYYSFADDSDCSVFQGFPPMFYLDTINPVRENVEVEEDFCHLDVEGQMGVFETYNKINTLDVDKINDTVNSISSLLKGVEDVADSDSFSFLKFFKDKFLSFGPHFSNLLSNIGHCLVSQTLKTFFWAGLSFLCDLGLIAFEYILKLSEIMFSIFRNVNDDEFKDCVAPSNDLYEGGVVGQMDDDLFSSYTSTLIAGVATVLNFSNYQNISIKDNKSILMMGLSDFSLTANKIFTFIRNNLEMIKQIFNKFCMSNDILSGVSWLKDHDNSIYDWAKRVLVLTDVRNENCIMSDYEKSLEVYLCANQACVIQTKLLKCKISSSHQQVIQKLICDILKLRDRLARLHIAPPVRFEPFVYYMYGKSGIGKSTYMLDICYDLLDSIGFRSNSEIVYVRSPGNSFWNGLTNQPVLHYDDFYCVATPEIGEAQVGELFQLKTRATFNPPMAHVDDKNIRYNPLILQIAANHPFPQINSAVCPDAVYRRRDLLVQCKWNPEFAKYTMNTLPDDYKNSRDYEYLIFGIHDTPLSTAEPNLWLSSKDFKIYLKDKFIQYYNKESVLYEHNLKQSQRLRPEDEETIFSFPNLINSDPLTNVFKEPDKCFVEAQMGDLIDKEKEILIFKCPHEYMYSKVPSNIEIEFKDNKWFLNTTYYNDKTDPTNLDFFCDTNPDICNKISENNYSICHTWCSGINCKFTRLNYRLLFVENYISSNSYLAQLKSLDISLKGLVPKEFLDFNSYSEDVDTSKVSFLKGCYFQQLFMNTLDTIMSWSKFNKALLYSISVCGLLAIPIKLYFMNKEKNKYCEDIDLEAQSSYVSGDLKTRGRSRKARDRTLNIFKKQAQGQMSDCEVQTVINVISQNTFFLTCSSESSSKSLVGRCLGLRGHFALIVDHYWDSFQKFRNKYNDAKLYFSNSLYPINVDLAWDNIDVLKAENSSLCVIKLPKNIPMFRNVTKFFINKENLDDCNGVGRIIEIVHGEKLCINVHNISFTEHCPMLVGGTENFDSFQTSELFSYQNFSGKGKCGSILLSSNIQKPIIGIHVAGTRDDILGFAETICFEQFIELEVFDRQVPLLSDPENCKLLIDTQVLIEGRIPDKFAHHESGQTRISPSMLQLYGNSFPVRCEPAVLSPKDKRLDEPFSPMLEGCCFHGDPMNPLPKDLIELATDHYLDKILCKVKPVRGKVSKLSKIDVCRGIDEFEGFDALEWRTSEGFPFSSLRPGRAKDKRWLFTFDKDNRCNGFDSLLLNMLKNNKKLRSENVIPNTLFVDCLKDCVIDKSKVLTPGKTRIFSISPVQFTIVQRQCTLDYSVSFMKGRFDNEQAIGINPDSMEWMNLYRYLSEIDEGQNCLSVDFSKFGDKLPSDLLFKCYWIIYQWYLANASEKTFPKSFHDFFRIAPHEVINASHLMFDCFYRVICGQPSGGSLTVILNSMVNSLLLRIAWMEIMLDTMYKGLDEFTKNVRFVSYGDDLILTVSNNVKSLFNGISLKKFYLKYNLKMTGSDKGDGDVPFTPLIQGEFLKRSFSPHPTRFKIGVMLAPLRVESIEETVNWIYDVKIGEKNSDNPRFREMSLQVCEDATRNAFTRGPKYYFQFLNKLKGFWRKYNLELNVPTWYDLDSRVFDLGELLTIGL